MMSLAEINKEITAFFGVLAENTGVLPIERRAFVRTAFDRLGARGYRVGLAIDEAMRKLHGTTAEAQLVLSCGDTKARSRLERAAKLFAEIEMLSDESWAEKNRESLVDRVEVERSTGK